MKVLLRKGAELNGFERQLQRTLEQANLAGYALMGFPFREAHGSQQYAIDALVLREPTVFVCLEAKGYSGEWTGSAGTEWRCNNRFDDREIQSVNGNPYHQVSTYSYVIRDRLNQQVFKDVKDANFFVNAFVVAPDGAEIAVRDAVVNQFELGTSIFICHLSRLENVIGSIWTTGSQSVVREVRRIGLKQIVSTLTGVPVDELDALITPGSQLKASINKRMSEKLTTTLAVAAGVESWQRR